MDFALNPVSVLQCLEGKANVAAPNGLWLLACFQATLFTLHSILLVARVLAYTLTRMISRRDSNECTLAPG